MGDKSDIRDYMVKYEVDVYQTTSLEKPGAKVDC